MASLVSLSSTISFLWDFFFILKVEKLCSTDFATLSGKVVKTFKSAGTFEEISAFLFCFCKVSVVFQKFHQKRGLFYQNSLIDGSIDVFKNEIRTETKEKVHNRVAARAVEDNLKSCVNVPVEETMNDKTMK